MDLQTLNSPHGVLTQKTTIYVFTVSRASNGK